MPQPCTAAVFKGGFFPSEPCRAEHPPNPGPSGPPEQRLGTGGLCAGQVRWPSSGAQGPGCGRDAFHLARHTRWGKEKPPLGRRTAPSRLWLNWPKARAGSPFPSTPSRRRLGPAGRQVAPRRRGAVRQGQGACTHPAPAAGLWRCRWGRLWGPGGGGGGGVGQGTAEGVRAGLPRPAAALRQGGGETHPHCGKKPRRACRAGAPWCAWRGPAGARAPAPAGRKASVPGVGVARRVPAAFAKGGFLLREKELLLIGERKRVAFRSSEVLGYL